MLGTTRLQYSSWILLENIVMALLIKGSMCSNTREVRDVDRICEDCRQECSNPSGWNLQGSDWGCCGNYDGCCTYASFLCYIHDALCRCCDAGDADFCGPTCKPEPDCLTPSTIPPCQQETDCLEASAELPCKPEADCQAASGSDINQVSDVKDIPDRNSESLKQTHTLKNSTTTKHFDFNDVENNYTNTQSESERLPSSQTVAETYKGRQTVTQSISNTQTVSRSFTSSQSVTESFTRSQTVAGSKNAETERTSPAANEDSISDGSGETEYRPFV